MVTITVFEADPAAGPPTAADAVLLRALRDDADFGFVEIAPGDAYEIVHQDGDVDGSGGTLLIEAFEVAAPDDAAFVAHWGTEHEARSAARGYLGTRLHRAAGPAALRWISVQRWSSPLMFQRLRQRHPPAPSPFASRAALCQPVAPAP